MPMRSQTNVDDTMAINRISIGRMALMFSFYVHYWLLWAVTPTDASPIN